MSQPSLFADLPTTVPTADSIDQLESVKRLLEAGVPGPAVVALMEHFGGCVLTCPSEARLTEDHRLAKALGLEAAQALARYAGNCEMRIYVPRGAAYLRDVRNQAIRKDFEHTPMVELCRRYQLTERQIWTILGSA